MGSKAPPIRRNASNVQNAPATAVPRNDYMIANQKHVTAESHEKKPTVPSRSKKHKLQDHFDDIYDCEETAAELLGGKYSGEYPVERTQSITNSLSSDNSSHSSVLGNLDSPLSPPPFMAGGELSAILGKAKPPVSIVHPALLWKNPPFRGGRYPLPSYTRQVIEWFKDTTELGVNIIPYGLKESFQRAKCNYVGLMDGLYNDLAHAKVFPDHLFGDQDEYSIGVDAGRYDSKLRHFVEVIIHKAAEAQLDNANEGGWSAIVERVLESPIENPLFKVCNVSTYNIEQSLIPVNRDDIPVKRSRVDYILGFNTSDASVDKVVAMYPDTSISVFKHIHHRAAAASFIGIEIKTLQGNYTDGLYQSTIHSTAVVTLWSRLREQAAAAETRESRKRASKKRATKKRNVHEPLGDFPPVPSIVVIGHQWNLHWTFLENDEQVIVGPIDMGSTMNILGTLKLLANVRKLKHWAEHGIGANDTGVWTKLAGWVEASNTG